MRRRSIEIILIVGVVLTAVGCAYSITGGLIGGILTAVLTGALLLGVGTTSSSCDSTVSTCLSMIPDTNEPDIGPCLTAPPADVIDEVVEDADVAPCLSDIFEPDIGPCLDRAPEDTSEPDIGPCLDPAPPDAQSALDPSMHDDARRTAMAASRTEVQERLIAEGVLPQDVAAQLKSEKEDA